MINTSTGQPVATFEGASSRFTPDGKHVASFSIFESKLIPLTDIQSNARNLTPTFAGGSSSEFIQFATSQQKPVDSYVGLIGKKWLLRNAHLYNLERRLLSWTYTTEDLNLLLHQPIGDQCMIVASSAGKPNATEIHVGVKTIPSAENVASMTSLTDEQLYVLRPGIQVRLDSSVMNPRIAPGIRRAIQAAGWSEAANSSIVIKAEAKRGESQTRTYSVSRFGFDSSSSQSPDQTLTATPWFQYVFVEHEGRRIWSTGGGGMPSFVSTREGDSLEAEIRKCEQESYSLFESFTFPEKLLAPKWSSGFGTTILTARGFVDRPVIP